MGRTRKDRGKPVIDNTAEFVNQQIMRDLEAKVFYFAQHPDLIDRRLQELDAEWDIERVLETNASVAGIVGLVLAKRNRKWLLLPFAVSSLLLQHAIQGWCPPVEIFRRMGIRTEKEINDERIALKTLRGDFDALNLASEKDIKTKVHSAMNAIR